MIKLRVYGMPAPQGSKKAFVVKGQARIVDDNKESLRAWRAAIVAEYLGQTITGRPPACLYPASVAVVFILPRPLAHYGTGRNRGTLKASAPGRPAGRPDLDKLARSTLDALTDAGVWGDDGQVYELSLAKVYQSSPAERPGAVIEITWGES